MDVYEALDLSDGEKKVYLALLKLKGASTGPIYKSAGVSQSKVYEILDRLKKKGLVSFIQKNETRYWSPANPLIYLEKLSCDISELKRRREILKCELPKLLEEEKELTEDVRVLEGYNGYRTVIHSVIESLKPGEELIFFGSPGKIPEPYYSFLKSINSDRLSKNIYFRMIYGESNRDLSRKIFGFKKTKVKFIDGPTPSAIIIGKDIVALYLLSDKNRFILIRSIEMANSYRMFFEGMWNIAHD